MVASAVIASGILNGVVWGLIIIVISLGMCLILGLMEIVNMAHGEFYMAGAVVSFYIVQWTGNWWLSLPIAFAVLAVMGLGWERGVLKHVEGDVIRTIIVTFGMSLIIMYTAHLNIVFGATSYRIPNPVPFNIVLPWFTYSGFRTVSGIIAVAILVALLLFLFKTKFGLWIRAGRTDKEMTSAMGIDIGKVSVATFMIGSAIAGIAGALVVSVAAVNTYMGMEALVYAFLVVIIGGLGSLKGTVIAGFIVAMVDSLGGILLTPLWAKVILLSILIAILVFRPKGIYGVWGE